MSEQVQSPEPNTENSPAEVRSEPGSNSANDAVSSDPRVQSGLSLLMEREAALQARQSELKAREEAVSRWESMESLSAVEKAEALGISLQDLQKGMVDQYDPQKEITQKLTRLEQRIKEQDERRERETLEAARNAEMEHVRTYVDGSKDYPLIKNLSFHDGVYDAIRAGADSGNKVSDAEAASNVENSLFDLVQKAYAIPEIRERLEAAARKKAEAEKPKSKPLTNKTSSNSAKPRKPGELLSFDEGLAEFAAILGG